VSVVAGSVGSTMTSTLEPVPVADGDDPATVLEHARAHKKAEDDAAREVMKDAARWAAMHSGDSLVGPLDEWHERCLPVGGEGCPEVAEFAVMEFAAAMGRSTAAGRVQLSRAVEGRYRLPRCWARLMAGDLAAWKLGQIADQTMCLCPEAAAYVDAKVAFYAPTITPRQLMNQISEAIALFDPEQTEAERQAAADARHVHVAVDQVTMTGTVHVDAEVDLADALDLETALSAGAHQQLLLGSTESMDVRRSIALGDLARGQQPLDLDTSGGQPRRKAKRQVVLHVHVSDHAVAGAGGLARVEEVNGPITAEQVRLWCGNPDTEVRVQPVIDLAEHIHVDAYEASERLKNQVDLRDVICVFPWCTRRARRCDHDHRVDHDDGGPTCSCNVAPLCRGHHRSKTTGGWTYVVVEPGVYLWRSPLGYQYLRDHTGTIDVTPDAERLKLARDFRAHFGDTDPEP